MTQVKHVRVQHVRTHKDYSVTLSPSVTLITGPNGSGKTSIIEAIYIALQGTSFKGSDSDIVSRHASWYRIDITQQDDTLRTVKFNPQKTTGRKEFDIESKKSYRLLAKNKYPVVLFEPDDLRLLSGSPTRRRDFLDQLIGKINPEYSTKLRRYERIVKQRNMLLKNQSSSHDDLFAWNVSLSEYGAYIIAQRTDFIHKINAKLSKIYNSIAQTNDTVTVAYSYHQFDNISQKLLNDLHAHIEKDRILGYTTTGPHRHDMLINFNNSPATSGASRGEIRTIILALKFLEVELIEDLTGKKPIILLDDVFSELDKDRQSYLISNFTNHQIIITSATSNARVKKDSLVITLS